MTIIGSTSLSFLRDLCGKALGIDCLCKLIMPEFIASKIWVLLKHSFQQIKQAEQEAHQCVVYTLSKLQ